MKRLLLFVLLMLLLGTVPALAQTETTVRLVHFTDYHSHAVPFYAEGEADTAGIARLIAYLKSVNDDSTLIFSGGDMVNRGSPAWSDKYGCVEWPWLNGLVDAMAYGNHDSDYGAEALAACQAEIDYPILGSNVVDADGQPVFTDEDQTYEVFEVNGVKIGVFAVAGPDFERLVTADYRPVTGATFTDRIEAAQAVVDALINEEEVNAVVLIGHALYEDDIALAQAVSGIDLIFGTHSHRQEELTAIPDSETVIISPFQYVTYLSQVELTFEGDTLTDISGSLVPMSSDLPEDPEIAAQVADLQAELRADPDYADLYVTLGEAANELSTEGQFTDEAVLGNLVMDVLRQETGAHLALSTASSFREPIPPGTILEETLLTALPYKNSLLVFDMTGEQVQELLDYSLSRSGSDFFSQLSGVRFNIVDGQAADVQILADPADPTAGYVPLDPAATYQVTTTNFQGLIAGGYKEIFAPASYTETGLDVWDILREYITANSPISAELDGRMSATAPAAAPEPAATPTTEAEVVAEATATPEAAQPGALPTTGDPAAPLSLWLLLIGSGSVLTGWWVRRRRQTV